jgi:AraC-like DNA-binding protein
MKANTFLLSTLFLIITSSSIVKAQQPKSFIIPDSLKHLSYNDVFNRFQKNVDISNKKLQILYANSYLSLAEKEKNIYEIIVGNGMIASALDSQEGVIYADKMIELSKTKQPDLLAFCYFRKGSVLYGTKKFKESLENLLLAMQYVNKKDLYMYNAIKYLIGVVRNSQGYYKEALSMFLECKDYYEKSKSNSYLTTICALAEVYNRLDKIEKADYYTNLGLQINNTNNDVFKQYFLIACRGKNNYKKQKYQQAIVDIKSTLSFLKNKEQDFTNYAENCYYIGKSYLALNQKEQAIDYFKKVDSVFIKEKHIYPDVVSSYTHIIAYYKKKGDLKKQLYYTEHLIEADSVIESNYNYLTAKIHKEYDIPQLMIEKETMITQLTQKDTFSTYKLIGLSTLVMLLFIIVIYYYRKQKKDHIIFEKLLLDTKSDLNKERISKSTPTVILTTLNLDIQQHIIDDILEKLKQFETNLGFLANDCILANVAKNFQTNANYLSKIVNVKKGVSFPVYINDLRIEYLIKSLQENSKLRMYSVKAIAQEVGFNNTQSFSQSFFNKTGLQPSFFIKQLKNKDL